MIDRVDLTAESTSETSEAQQRVLDVAETLFMQQGYSSITLRDIAGALGIRQASLYYHFPKGKEQIYVTMAERLFERHRVGLEGAIAASGDAIAPQLTAAADWFAGQAPMNLSSMMHADMPALSPEAAAHITNAAYACIFTPLRSIFLGAQARDEARTMNADVMAGMFLAILDSAHFSGSGPGIPTRESMFGDIISVVLDGLRPRP